MVAEIDSAFRTDGFFEGIEKQAWQAMNSYTHSGIRQLSRRFDNGRITPNYSEEEITEVIDGATMSLLNARLFCLILNKPQEAEEAAKLIKKFDAS